LVALKQGETLVFYTDGFTEAMDNNDQEYGNSGWRLDRAPPHLPAADMIRTLCDDVASSPADVHSTTT